MSCSGSPKVNELAAKVGDISIGEEATAATQSPRPATSPQQIGGSPKPKRNDGSPKTGSPKVGSPKVAGSPVVGSPKTGTTPKSPKESKVAANADGVKKEDIVKADGSSPKDGDEVFEKEGKDAEGKKSDEEQDENSQEQRERRRSRTNSYRYRNPAFAGMVSPPFRDNYFKHGLKSETDEGILGDGSPKKKQVGSIMPKHDRPGFFVGRTRKQSEKSTDGGEKKEGTDGEGEQEARKPRRGRNRQRRGPPPDMDMEFYQPQPRGNFRNNYYRQSSYQPQPYYQQQQGFNNYYQGQSYQQRPNFNRFYSQPGNGYGRQQFNQQQPQYLPRAFRNQQGSSSSFYDTFGGDQPQKQRNKRQRKNRSRTNSKRDRTVSTASNSNQASDVKSEARDVAIAVQST